MSVVAYIDQVLVESDDPEVRAVSDCHLGQGVLKDIRFLVALIHHSVFFLDISTTHQLLQHDGKKENLDPGRW